MRVIEKEPWVNFLEGDVLGKESEGGKRVYQVLVRIQASGLLAIVKARAGSGYFVAFVGGGTLPGLATKIREVIGGDETKWREDSFPPT